MNATSDNHIVHLTDLSRNVSSIYAIHGKNGVGIEKFRKNYKFYTKSLIWKTNDYSLDIVVHQFAPFCLILQKYRSLCS